MTPADQLSATKYSLLTTNGDGSVILGIVKTMTIKSGCHYKIKPSKSRGGAKYCRVISVSSQAALCELGKPIGRGYYARANWLDGEYTVPFNAFLEELL